MTQQCALIDINVILDVLAKREPHFAASVKVWELVEKKKITGMLAAYSFPTLFYLYYRQTSRQFAATAIQKLLAVFKEATEDQEVIELAMTLNWPNFEDALQMAAAVKSQAVYLVTRNPGDYKMTPVPVIQPGDFAAVIAASDAGI